MQEIKFLRGQAHFLSAEGDGALDEVDLHIMHADDFLLLHDVSPGAAQHGANPRAHLQNVERFGHVVVRTHQKAGVLVLGQGLGRQHQDGHHAAAIPDGLGQGKAIHFRHHHIAQQQVNVLVVDDVQRRFAVEGRDRFIAVDL